MKRIYKFTLYGLLFLVAATLFVTALTLVTQALWNWLVPALFAGPLITFWQTFGLLALTKILFWPVGRGGRHWAHRMGGPNRHWAARWESMSPDDRQRFKEKMKEKWCRPRASATPVDGGNTP